MLLPADGSELLTASRARAGAWTIALAFVLFLLPTLRWLEFSYGIESIHVATVLEMERTGEWLAPTLNDAPRIKKPPLPGWITSVFVTDGTMRALDGATAIPDDPAYRALAWRVRLPALLACGIAIGLVFEIGLVIGGARVAFFGTLVAGSAALLIHKHARQALPDVYLMLFYAVAVLGLVRAMFAGKRDGWLVAGLGLGLGLMCKGPVILLQAIVPVACAKFLLDAPFATPWRRHLPMLLVGGVLMLTLGLWWYGLIALRNPEVMQTWYEEVTRDGALDQRPGKFYVYFNLIPWMHPWTVLIFAGVGLLIVSGRNVRQTPHLRAALFGLICAAVPLALMAIAKDRKERYMLPMVLPAAIGVGGVLVEHLRGLIEKRRIDRTLAIMTCLSVALVLILVPWVGGVLLPQLDQFPAIANSLSDSAGDIPVYSKRFADVMVFAGVPGVIAIGWLLIKRPLAGLVGVMLLSLVAATVVAYGYQHTESGLSELRPLAEVIRRDHPDAKVFFRTSEGDTATSNLAIYLNAPVPEMPEPEKASPAPHPIIVVIDKAKGTPRAPGPAWREIWRNRDESPTRAAFCLGTR